MGVTVQRKHLIADSFSVFVAVDHAVHAYSSKCTVVLPVTEFKTTSTGRNIALLACQQPVCPQTALSQSCCCTPCADSPREDSQAAKFPLAAYAPYTQPGFVWNPPGTGLAMEEFGFPIMLLDNTTAPQAAQRAAYNAQHVSNFISCTQCCR